MENSNTTIKELRWITGMTMSKFAREVGMVNSFLSVIEKGKKTPGNKTISKVCEYMGITRVMFDLITISAEDWTLDENTKKTVANVIMNAIMEKWKAKQTKKN